MSADETRSAARVYPPAITGTWGDLERHAWYVYECMDHDTTNWMLAEAVLVLLAQPRLVPHTDEAPVAPRGNDAIGG